MGDGQNDMHIALRSKARRIERFEDVSTRVRRTAQPFDPHR
jgi:hypothetical protein